jgi:hypothetical protein
MTTIKTIIVAAAVSILSLGAAQAAEQTLKPRQGASFHSGAKHAVAYFLSEDRTCKLALTVVDDTDYAQTRFEASLEPGKSTRYPLAEGTQLEFDCQAEARAMIVRPLEAVAGQ